jgi:acyl-CoA reductase-like NAD-dependent aldehyde dehydrogenase
MSDAWATYLEAWDRCTPAEREQAFAAIAKIGRSLKESYAAEAAAEAAEKKAQRAAKARAKRKSKQ